ncbi:hypothetical protein [Sneathiella sp.]|uniref:hypothetical protein n=1 Tax=Sneathiella sp. TaxID=1964365 RepID=UPI002FE2A1D6
MTARSARHGRNQGGKGRKRGGGGNGNGLTKSSRSKLQRAARRLTMRIQGRHSARRHAKKIQHDAPQAA